MGSRIVIATVVGLAGLLALSSEARAGTLWASDSGGGSSHLYKIDSTTGAVLQTLPGPGLFADALSFTNDGLNIWVLDSSTNSDMYRIDLLGNVQQSFSVALDAEGLTILADGSLYVGGGVSGVIAKVNAANGAILSSFSVASQIFGMASNGTNELYGLRINGVIDRYDLSGNLLGSIVTGASGTTLGLAYTGSSFFIASVGSTIYEVGLNGAVLNSFNGPGSFTEGLDFPEGVQVPASVPLPAAAPLGLSLLGALGLLRRRRKA